MKKILFSMGVMLAATFTLTNCTSEMDHPVQAPSAEGAFEIIAKTADTTPVFLPGKSHGQRSLAGCSP